MNRKEKATQERFYSIIGKGLVMGYISKEEIKEYVSKHKEILKLLNNNKYEEAHKVMADLIMKIQIKRMVEY